MGRYGSAWYLAAENRSVSLFVERSGERGQRLEIYQEQQLAAGESRTQSGVQHSQRPSELGRLH